MKALGAEIWDFWHNAWPAGYYNDDSSAEIEDDKGGCLLDPAAKYDLSEFGVICKEDASLMEAEPFSKFFLAWKKEQTMVTLVIEVPKAKVEEIKLHLAESGVKVRGLTMNRFGIGRSPSGSPAGKRRRRKGKRPPERMVKCGRCKIPLWEHERGPLVPDHDFVPPVDPMGRDRRDV